MASRTRVVWIGRHDSLLHRKHEVVRRVDGRRWNGRVAPAQTDLKRANGLAQAKRRFHFLLQSKHFDFIQERIRVGKQ